MSNDTFKLLRECNAGIKMGADAFKRVLPRIKDEGLKNRIEDCNSVHCLLGDRTHEALKEIGALTKPPHPIASAISDVKISVQLFIDDSDRQLAALMTDGCHMGIKALCHYLNKYTRASKEARELAMDIISSEDKLLTELRGYL